MAPPSQLIAFRCPEGVLDKIRAITRRTRLDRTRVLLGLLRTALGAMDPAWSTDEILAYIAPSDPQEDDR